MPKYYLTFGTKYAEEQHPYFHNAHPDGWVEIESQSEMEARVEAYDLFEDKWAFIYDEKNFNPTNFRAGRIATAKEIKEEDTENLLFYKKHTNGSKNSIAIVSEVEFINTLPPEKMMVMNNVNKIFNHISTFTRIDKFKKKVDDCMENISRGLPDGDEQVRYIINLKNKTNDLITAVIHGEKVLPTVIFLPEYNGEKETCIKMDRTRTVNYNGNEIRMNNYQCSSCKMEYIMEEQPHKSCPFCGIVYKFDTDISI